MSRRPIALRLFTTLCVALAAALGCSSADGVTQIELSVDSDLDVPDELDRVAIEVRGMVTDEPAVADLREQPLPRTLTLVHQGGPLGPVRVTARGLLDGDVVVERSVQLTFVAGQTVRETIELRRRDTVMPAGDGGSGDDAGMDAGMQDAGGEDGGLDAGDDAGSDAGDAATSDSGADSGTDSGTVDAGDSGSAVNDPPVCTISEPAADAALIAGQLLRFVGRCTDPDTGRRISTGLRWSSSLDGQLGAGVMIDVVLSDEGAHVISLCAPDPVDSSIQGCGTLNVSVSNPTPPTVSIDSATQSNSSAQPFGTGPAVVLTGSASGQEITLAWRDTFVGGFGGNALQASLMSPTVGRHTVWFTATDNVGQSMQVTTTFVVLPNGSGGKLVQAFGATNTALALPLAGGTRVDALARDSADHALLAANGPPPSVYRLDGGNTNAAPAVALTAPTLTGAVRAITISEADGKVYLATAGGLTVCGYAANSGVDSGACTTFKDGDFPSGNNDTTAVVRARANGTDYLAVGTRAGLLVTTTLAGSSTGETPFDDHEVAGMVAAGDTLWIATADGLYELDLAGNGGGNVHAHAGGPSDQLTAIAIDQQGGIWVGSDNGVGRYDPVRDAWLILRTNQSPQPGLPSNTIRALATSRVTLNSVAHDIAWVGTDAGVTRIDFTLASLMNLTMDDGLPSGSIRSLVVLADGSKLIGTDSGLGRYLGP